MIYRFDDFTLDAARFELRKGGEPLPAEPQVLSLILLLAENRERMVSKDELVEKIWGGRIVSDSAISSRVKSARQLLGDDGKAQRLIRTVHCKGFRFAGSLRIELSATAATQGSPAPAPPPQRPSIAVLPFGLLGAPGRYGAIADALPHELIAELSRLRWLFVIARGSSFRFRGPEADAIAAGRALGVAYFLSGQVEIADGRLAVTVELADTRDGAAIWGERYSGPLDAVHEFRAGIAASIVAALELRIPAHEAERARLGGSGNLDAWAAYHLGLEQLYRYNRADNAAARALFEQAVALDPAFARAHAAIGFARFQEGFMRYGVDADAPRLAARAAAERAIALDPLDPFVNHVMGRVSWLEGDLGGSLAWLDRATGLSPSYAQGVYVGGLARALTGAAEQALGQIELAVELSPLDPLRYGMLSTRGIAHVLLGNHDEAVRWAEMAVHSPGAHKHIALVAAVACEAAGERERAAQWVARARRMDPAIAAADFLRSFPFSDGQGRSAFAEALARHGL